MKKDVRLNKAVRMVRKRTNRWGRGSALSCVVFSVLLSIYSLLAVADELEYEGVLQRARPELDPIGIGMGATLIYPKLSYASLFDNNIFATEKNKESDFISILSPEIKLNSDWGKYFLTVKGNADIGRYKNSSSENFEDWGLFADSNIEIHHDRHLLGSGSFKHHHLPRYSSDDVLGSEPTVFDEGNLSARYSYDLGRFAHSVYAAYQQKDFSDVPSDSGTINQDDRDRREFSVGYRSSYELMQRHQLFVQIRHFRRDYIHLQDVSNFDRDSKSYELMVGTTYERLAVTKVEFDLGIFKQNYFDPLPNVSTPVFDATIDWNLSRLTNIRFEIRRTVDESSRAKFSGIVSTTSNMSIAHELKRSFLLNAGVERKDSDYLGIDNNSTRNELIYGFRTGFLYMINRKFYFLTQYEYSERKSTDSTLSLDRGNDFEKQVLVLQLQTQL